MDTDEPAFNIRDFGARGDGKTADSEAGGDIGLEVGEKGKGENRGEGEHSFHGLSEGKDDGGKGRFWT